MIMSSSMNVLAAYLKELLVLSLCFRHSLMSLQLNQTVVNEFSGLKGLTGIKQLIPLNPESTLQTGETTVLNTGRDFECKAMQNGEVQSRKPLNYRHGTHISVKFVFVYR